MLCWEWWKIDTERNDLEMIWNGVKENIKPNTYHKETSLLKSSWLQATCNVWHTPGARLKDWPEPAPKS